MTDPGKIVIDRNEVCKYRVIKYMMYDPIRGTDWIVWRIRE